MLVCGVYALPEVRDIRQGNTRGVDNLNHLQLSLISH
jgi:hypothetical protein